MLLQVIISSNDKLNYMKKALYRGLYGLSTNIFISVLYVNACIFFYQHFRQYKINRNSIKIN